MHRPSLYALVSTISITVMLACSVGIALLLQSWQ